MSRKSTISEIIEKSSNVCDYKHILKLRQGQLDMNKDRALYYWIEREIAQLEILEMIK